MSGLGRVTVRRPPLWSDAQLAALLAPLANPRQVTEARFQQIVTQLLDAYGWKWAHPARCKSPRGQWLTATSKGYPDLTCVSADGRILILELKKEDGTLDSAQRPWVNRFQRAARVNPYVHAFVCRPSQINTLLTYLAAPPIPPPIDPGG